MGNQGMDTLSTRDKLIRVSLELFSKYGYDATTIRMIASAAKVNVAAVSFHFSGKESLYSACLDFIAQKTEGLYGEIVAEADALLERENVTTEEAFGVICKIADRQIDIAFGKKYRTSIMLTYWEQVNRTRGYCPVTNAIFNTVERAMARLIAKSSGMEYKKAVIASRFINGSIISFGEHALLVQYALGEEGDGVLQPWIRDEIVKYSGAIIRKALSMPQREEKD